jgi:peptide chain release factor 3
MKPDGPVARRADYLVQDIPHKVAAALEMAPFETARWISSDDPAALKEFMDLNRGAMAKDRDGNPVFMAKSAWEVGYIADRYSKVKFAATRER